MKIIRSPEERFMALPDFPFAPNYFDLTDNEFPGLRMHYLDEGSPEAPVVLLMHGQGCWSYIFRHMIPVLTEAGLRVIAPDFIGFGRSDKLPSTEDYSFQKHVDWIINFLDGMMLQDINAYLFDWGGFFGLRIAGERPEFFSRIALSNTNLPHGDARGRDWFIKWRAEQFAMPRFPQGEMVNEGAHFKLSPETIAAFDAPYPDESYKTGPRRFPMILPISADDPASPANAQAWKQLGKWQKPVLTLFSAAFEGSAMGPERLIEHIPGCRNQEHALLEEANFYLVEDQPVEIARRLLKFFTH